MQGRTVTVTKNSNETRNMACKEGERHIGSSREINMFTKSERTDIRAHIQNRSKKAKDDETTKQMTQPWYATRMEIQMMVISCRRNI